MSTVSSRVHNVDEQRQQAIDELVSDEGPDWHKRYEPGSFGCHELLDRTALLAEQVESQLVAHPACVHNAEWHALAVEAAAALHELYQQVGATHMADNKADNGKD